MQLFKNLANHKLAVFLCFVLLIAQAFCDLSLPNLTSDIVNVGIQQSGVEHVATDELTERTYTLACMVGSDDEEALVKASYDKSDDGVYRLNDNGRANRDALDEALTVAMLVAHPSESMAAAMEQSAQAGEASAAAAASASTGSGDETASSAAATASTSGTSTGSASASISSLDQAISAYQAGVLTKSQIQSALATTSALLGGIDQSLLSQTAITSAQAELESLGYEIADVQMAYLMTTGSKMLLMAAGIMVIVILVALIASRTSAAVARDLRSRFFARVLSFSDREIGSFSAASLITRGTNDIQLIQTVTSMMMRMVLYTPILAIGGIIMVATKAPSMAWVIALAVAVLMIFVVVLMIVTLPKFKIMQTLIDKVNLVAREILTGLPVIRAFGRESREQARFEDASAELMRTQLFTNRVMTLMMPVMQLIMNFVSVAIIWFGGIQVSDGVLQTGDLIALITYSMVIIISFLLIGVVCIIVPRAAVAAGRVQEVIECESSILDPREPQDASLKTDDAGVEVAFDHVSFAFDKDSENALADLTFTFPAGKVSAIVGPTGSGKSTVIKLIERFYDVTAGRVLVDGIDVRNLSQKALRTQFGYVPQASFLFGGDIESNVSYGDRAMGEDRVEEALAIAQASDFVSEKEEGLRFAIAQGGTNVSGGQRQRLAIARAVAVPARGYLFDDSFSALDYKTDQALRAAIADKLAGRTVVIVAQRIATIMNADHIVVLDEGRVAGQGTHEHLMKTCPVYRDIARSQLSEEELARSVKHEPVLEGGERHDR